MFTGLLRKSYRKKNLLAFLDACSWKSTIMNIILVLDFTVDIEYMNGAYFLGLILSFYFSGYDTPKHLLNLLKSNEYQSKHYRFMRDFNTCAELNDCLLILFLMVF